VADTVAPSGWKYYSIEVPSGASQLEVKTTGATADVDLYVRFGALPSSDNWDYRPYTLSGNETVTVTPSSAPRPLQAGTWYAGVYGFLDGGSYTITATVTGGSTCTLACTATVPATGTVGSPVTFASTATPSNCTGSPTFAWTFGDGQTSTQQNPSHTFASAGTYAWTFAATVQGVTCTRSGSVTISSGGGTAYAWTFGDGQSSAQQSPSHTYASPGTYTWSMTATWNGKSCSKTGTVTAGGGVPGDCDGSGTVSIGEVQKAINMFLGSIPPDCGVDCNGDGAVSIGEVQKVINGFLGLATGC
jgi:PKD repeat protein